MVAGVEQYWMNNYVYGRMAIILVCLHEKRLEIETWTCVFMLLG